MVWYSHLFQKFPQFIVIHTVKGFVITNKAEKDIFLELFSFFHDPADVGNLISESFTFSKSSMYIWKFLVHILMKPSLKEQYCLGTWNARCMNRGKLDMVKQEMARANIEILGISELKWTGMNKFNSDDHYIYCCGQKSLRRNGVALIVNKRV